jgi:plasmid maintenance system antidote protein VapI
VPRHPKDPTNPITRLRKALSTPQFDVTRKIFAERYRLPLDSITALERGTYRLNNEMAVRISSATGVSFTSLFLNQEPLRDWKGRVVTPETGPPSKPLDESHIESAKLFLGAAIEATRHAKGRATTRDRSAEFYGMFLAFLSRAVHELDVDEPFRKLLPKISAKSSDENSKSAVSLLRKKQIKEAEIDVLGETLPAKDADRLKRFLTDQESPESKRLSHTPAEVERLIGLQRRAYSRLAKKHAIKYDEMNWKPVEELIHRLALEKLG